MNYQQIRTPNPNVPCMPGWCLKYVQDTFSIGAKYPTAMAAWNASEHKHGGDDFPAGVAVPVYFAVKDVPDGHVALRMADGSIYSASSPVSDVPVHHASLAAMQQYWGNGTMLTVLGWTEDCEDTLVVEAVADTAVSTLSDSSYVAWNGSVTVTASYANVRSVPTTEGNAPLHTNAQGQVISVVGYTHGENVDGNDVWLKAWDGNWVWSGNTSWTAPASAAPQQGTVTVEFSQLNVRSAPNTSAPIVGSGVLYKGEQVQYVAIVTGEDISEGGVTSNQWYKSIYGHYFWAGGCK